MNILKEGTWFKVVRPEFKFFGLIVINFWLFEKFCSFLGLIIITYHKIEMRILILLCKQYDIRWQGIYSRNNLWEILLDKNPQRCPRPNKDDCFCGCSTKSIPGGNNERSVLLALVPDVSPYIETSVLPVIQPEIPLQLEKTKAKRKTKTKKAGSSSKWLGLPSEWIGSILSFVCSILGAVICMPELFPSLLIAVPLEKRNIPWVCMRLSQW